MEVSRETVLPFVPGSLRSSCPGGGTEGLAELAAQE